MYKTIFLDMDGVLCDFESHYMQLTGKDFHSFEHRQEGWDFIEPYKEVFFETMPTMPDTYDLVDGVEELAEQYNCTVAILTAVPKIGRIPTARIQKYNWINGYFPQFSCTFNIGPHAQHKQFHCIPGDILIDDSPKNIPQWNDVGGFGILHSSAVDSLARLKLHLEK